MKETTFIQKCIPMKGVLAVLDYVPETIQIRKLDWEFDFQRKWAKIPVNEKMLKKGMINLRQTHLRTNSRGIWVTKSRDFMRKAIQEIAEEYNIPLDKVVVRKLVLRNKKKTEVMFKMMRKNEQLPNDKRKKLVVLGLCNKNGKAKISNSYLSKEKDLLDELGARDVHCRKIIERKETLYCSSDI